MITIFNRREAMITRDMTAMNDAVERLNAAGIETRVHAGPIGGAGRSHGVPGIDAEHAYEYRIYVRRADYEKAKHMIRGRR